MLAGVAAGDEGIDHHRQGGDAALAGEHVALRRRRVVAALREADGARLGGGDDARLVERETVALLEVAEHLALVGAGRDLGERDVLERLGDELERVDLRTFRNAVEHAPEHVHGARAAGDETDADLDETRVGLGRGLHRVAREAELETAAEGHAVRRGDDGDGRVLQTLGRVLVALHHRADLLPLLRLGGHDDEQQVRAHAEVLAFVGDDESAEVLLRLRRRVAEHLDDVGVDRVRLRLEGEPEHAVTEIPRFGAVVLEHRSATGAQLAHRLVARVELARDVLALREIPHLAVGGVEALRPRRLHLRDGGGQLDAVLLHAVDGLGETERVPGLERAELPVVAPLHGVIDGHDVVGDLAHAASRIGERAREHLPRVLAGLARIGHQLLHALLVVLDLRETLGELGDGFIAALRAVLARLGVERRDALVGVPLVEAALGLVAELLLLDHRADVGRHREDLAVFVVHQRRVAVLGDVDEGVEADQVRRAEAGALRVAHRRAGDVVDVFGSETVFQHLMDRHHHRVGADAVADEVRRVFADDDALAEDVLAELGDALHRLGRGVRTRHQLEQLHVANRVEEVHHEEALLEGGVAAFHHRRDTQARGVRGHDGVGGDDLLELGEQALLRLELLDDGLDHEVTFAGLLEVVFHVARRDELRERGMHERGRPRLQRLLEAPRSEAIAVLLVALLFVAEVRGNDVEEQHADTCVGEVGRDAAPHDAAPDHANVPDRSGHGMRLL